MQPTGDLKTQLFSGQQDRVQEFFFDHVVGKSSIMPIVVSRGPTSVPFLFNYANRRNPELVRFCIKNFRFSFQIMQKSKCVIYSYLNLICIFKLTLNTLI